MQMGMIGLGRMGANMVRRLLRGGHQCVVFDVSPKAVADLAKEGAVGASSFEDFAAKLDKPRVHRQKGHLRGNVSAAKAVVEFDAVEQVHTPMRHTHAARVQIAVSISDAALLRAPREKFCVRLEELLNVGVDLGILLGSDGAPEKI